MLIFYIICLVLGGSLLAFSLFSGDGDFGEELELSVADSDVIAIPPDAVDSDLSSAIDTVKFLSIRNLIYFLTFFGMTGTIFSYLGLSSIITFLSASGIGTFSALSGYKFMKYLKNSETGDAVSLKHLIGKQAIVTFPVRRATRGKILIEHNGQSFEINALIAEESPKELFDRKERVIITAVSANIAKIVESEI